MVRALNVDMAMRIATEHLSYRSLVEEIESDLERIRADASASIDELQDLLVAFTKQMRRHFALEERGGLYDVYRSHDTASRRHAQAMLDEHRDFSERMQRILRGVRSLRGGDDPDLERTERELRELFHDLDRHERVEDALLKRLVEQDIPGPG